MHLPLVPDLSFPLAGEDTGGGKDHKRWRWLTQREMQRILRPVGHAYGPTSRTHFPVLGYLLSGGEPDVWKPSHALKQAPQHIEP
jgi:hypothetical protein